jgi:hypothetical protein
LGEGLAVLALALLVRIGLTVWASRWHVEPKGIGGRNNWLVYPPPEDPLRRYLK